MHWGCLCVCLVCLSVRLLWLLSGIALFSNNFLPSCTLFAVMTNFLTSWGNVWRHDVFLTLWWTFDVMTYIWRHDELCDVMSYFLTSWRTFWRNDARFDVKANFFDVMTWWHDMMYWRHDVFLTSWRTFRCHDIFCDVMTYFWSRDERCDVMIPFLCHDVCLTSWPPFWPHGVFLTLWLTFRYPDEFYDVMTHFLPSWRTC